MFCSWQEGSEKVKQITVYKTNYCPACHQVVPLIKKLARKKGVAVTVVDVEKCGQPCDWVRFVPALKVDGKRAKIGQVLKELT